MTAMCYDRFVASEAITTGAASAQSGAVPAGVTHAWMVCSASCWATTGANPTAVAGAANNFLITPTPVRIQVKVGDKIAAIQEGAAAKFGITYVDGVGY
jgi:hypothetical protein